MNRPKDLNILRRKVQIIAKPQSTISAIKRQKAQTAKTPPLTFNTHLLDDLGAIKNQNLEEISKLEQQKKILAAKLSQLTQDYALEEQKKKKLEDELAKAKRNANNHYYQPPENDDIQARFNNLERKVEDAQQKFRENLSKLEDLRAQLNIARKQRKAEYGTVPISKNNNDDDEYSPFDQSYDDQNYDEIQDLLDNVEVHELEQSEKEEIDTYLRYMEQLSFHGALKKNAFASTLQPHSLTPQINDVVQQTESYQLMINKILEATKMKDVGQLLSETEKLEKKNKQLYGSIINNTQAKEELMHDIKMLENQYNELVSHRNSTEEDHKAEIKKIFKDLQEIQGELAEIELKRQQEENTFSPVYAQLEELFNVLECSWEDSPDEKTNVTTANAMFALSAIEATLAELMNDPSSKAKVMNQLDKLQEEYQQYYNEEEEEEEAKENDTKESQKTGQNEENKTTPDETKLDEQQNIQEEEERYITEEAIEDNNEKK